MVSHFSLEVLKERNECFVILGFMLSPDSPFHHTPLSTMKWDYFLIFPSLVCCSGIEVIMQNCVLMSVWHLPSGDGALPSQRHPYCSHGGGWTRVHPVAHQGPLRAHVRGNCNPGCTEQEVWMHQDPKSIAHPSSHPSQVTLVVKRINA